MNDERSFRDHTSLVKETRPAECYEKNEQNIRTRPPDTYLYFLAYLCMLSLKVLNNELGESGAVGDFTISKIATDVSKQVSKLG